MKRLTTKQAWEKIAQMFSGIANGDRRRGVKSWGICVAIAALHRDRYITASQRGEMYRQLEETFHADADSAGYWWGFFKEGRADDGARAIAAQLMAEMAGA